MLAATNRPEILDPALMRPGRFDRQVLVFKQATEIARLMLTEYGMSDALGPVSYAERSRSPFLRGPEALAGLSEKACSERTQRRIDQEVFRLVEEAMQRARDLVAHHREALGKVAARLLQHETLEGDELRRSLVEAGALPAEKVGLAAEQAREEEEAHRRQGA